MVEPDDVFLNPTVEVELGGEEDPVEGNIILTEGGELTIEFEEESGPRHQNLTQTWKEIEGIDTRGYSITAENVASTNFLNHTLTEISPTDVIIENNSDFAPSDGQEVVVEFDILCFLQQIPPRNQITTEFSQKIEEISEQRSDWPSMELPNEIYVKYIEKSEYEVFGIPLTDTTDRRDKIKETKNPIRTAKIRVKQDIHGDLPHQVEKAENIVNKILELTQLVQEVTPRQIRGKVVSIDGSDIEDTSYHYEILKSGSTASVGACYDQYPKKVLWGNFHEYINQSYENYTDRVRDELRLRQVLGYYVDARNPDRPIQGKLLSICSAIELFALWHAREDEKSERTAPKIEHLIEKLGVETEDLANHAVEDVESLNSKHYFWRDGRNNVAHGDPEVPNSQLITTYQATLVLLKRMIRNQILGQENAGFEDFYSMEPRSSIEFEE